MWYYILNFVHECIYSMKYIFDCKRNQLGTSSTWEHMIQQTNGIILLTILRWTFLFFFDKVCLLIPRSQSMSVSSIHSTPVLHIYIHTEWWSYCYVCYHAEKCKWSCTEIFVLLLLMLLMLLNFNRISKLILTFRRSNSFISFFNVNIFWLTFSS